VSVLNRINADVEIRQSADCPRTALHEEERGTVRIQKKVQWGNVKIGKNPATIGSPSVREVEEEKGNGVRC